MSLLSWIVPSVLYQSSSPYNRDIRVVRVMGRNKLLVNGSPQSGPFVRSLWKHAFNIFRINSQRSIASVLVLGIGGGTVIDMVFEKLPNASITAVDIDPAMIMIAKKYFHLNRYKNLRLIHQDAEKFIAQCAKRNTRYDLIIVDLFSGRDIPAFVSSEIFLSNFKHIMAPNGSLLINYLRELEYQSRSDELFRLLQPLFPTVQDCTTHNNRFFYLQSYHNKLKQGSTLFWRY